MRVVSYLAIAFLALSLTPALGADTAVDRAKKDEIVAVPKGDPDTEAAFRQARETLKGFLELARAPCSSITSMAVKVAIRDRGETEYFWISPFKEKDGGFVGTIDNTPRSVRNVKLGQTITLQTSDIVDWLYREDGKMFGNYRLARCSSRRCRQNGKRSRGNTGLIAIVFSLARARRD